VIIFTAKILKKMKQKQRESESSICYFLPIGKHFFSTQMCIFAMKFALLSMTFEEIKQKLSNKTVGIAGAGGLGSNCAVALSRVGVGTLIITDFDVVSESNLNRQYYFFNQIGQKKSIALHENIQKINPFVKVVSHDIVLTRSNIPSIFENCDVIVEALDHADQKEMLIETLLTEMPDKPLVIGLGMAGWGMNDTIHCRKVDNLYICGDEISEISNDLPPIAPRVGIVANMQANIVVEILLMS
jgi:sulfur carrier protein ThiS adenylyltransferase